MDALPLLILKFPGKKLTFGMQILQVSPPTTTTKSQGIVVAADQREERTAAAITTCKAIDSWALALFALAAVASSVLYSLIYGFSGRG